MTLPEIQLVVATYFPPGTDGELRKEGFRESLQSWWWSLCYDGEVKLTIANDGDLIPHFEEWPGVQFCVGQGRGGLGKALNEGLRRAFLFTPLVLNIPDDAMLTQSYELTPWARLLLENENVGAVHLSHYYPGTAGEIMPLQHGWVVALERHNLAAGLRPCLYHKRFFDAYGWFDEALSAHETERLFNERFCQSKGPESVLALPLPWAEGIGSKVLLGQITPGVAA